MLDVRDTQAWAVQTHVRWLSFFRLRTRAKQRVFCNFKQFFFAFKSELQHYTEKSCLWKKMMFTLVCCRASRSPDSLRRTLTASSPFQNCLTNKIWYFLEHYCQTVYQLLNSPQLGKPILLARSASRFLIRETSFLNETNHRVISSLISIRRLHIASFWLHILIKSNTAAEVFYICAVCPPLTLII